MSEKRWSETDLGEALGIGASEIAELLAGSKRVTLDLARQLTGTVGGSTRFWLSRDARYCESMEWVAADRQVSLLPLGQMVRLGWIRETDDWVDTVGECTGFFGLERPGEFSAGWNYDTSTRFRAKPHSPAQDAAIAAWVRRVQIEAGRLACGPWDPDAVHRTIPDLASLSRERDPDVFIPYLQELGRSCGIALVVVRPPSGCPVSGVSIPLPSGHRAIGLSGRYLADDHLWFTLMHELGHLLVDNGKHVFIDDIERSPGDHEDECEREADAFASDALLPPSVRSDLGRDPSPFEVRRSANEAGVSEGVVVGQLQHLGQIPYSSRLNRLKRRYRWTGTRLARRTA